MIFVCCSQVIVLATNASGSLKWTAYCSEQKRNTFSAGDKLVLALKCLCFRVLKFALCDVIRESLVNSKNDVFFRNLAGTSLFSPSKNVDLCRKVWSRRPWSTVQVLWGWENDAWGWENDALTFLQVTQNSWH